MQRPGCRKTSSGSRQPLVVCDAMCCARLGNRDSMDPWDPTQTQCCASTGAASEGPSLQVLGQWPLTNPPPTYGDDLHDLPGTWQSAGHMPTRRVAGRPAHIGRLLRFERLTGSWGLAWNPRKRVEICNGWKWRQFIFQNRIRENLHCTCQQSECSEQSISASSLPVLIIDQLTPFLPEGEILLISRQMTHLFTMSYPCHWIIELGWNFWSFQNKEACIIGLDSRGSASRFSGVTTLCS